LLLKAKYLGNDFNMQIAAILSDYDGTLCPTGSIRCQDKSVIPKNLEDILWDISDKIPVCIVSSKDFSFLHARAKFAKVISCILGIETLTLKNHKQGAMMNVSHSIDSFKCSENLDCIESRYLLSNDKILQVNSRLLSSIAKEILLNFNQTITVERKFTSDKQILAGITIDWRNIKDWKSFKVESEPHLKKLIRKKQQEISPNNRCKMHIQTYTTHPFIDVYAAKCDKGMAFDFITSQIPTSTEGKPLNIMYLGDSENDNPAFRKAAVSIGVHSDIRLKPKLSCEYDICFDELPIFLKDLLDKDLQFSDTINT
jgi:hydroxymethylpyrimidine pyrophosphatase-like HAD family hydrolase